MKPVRTYEVTVTGFPGVLYSARSPGKARARAWREYITLSEMTTFKAFLSISIVRRVPDPPGCGERIVVNGRTVTKVYSPVGHRRGVHFMPDDSDAVLAAHPADVLGAAPSAGRVEA